jgi:hypothetical protein
MLGNGLLILLGLLFIRAPLVVCVYGLAPLLAGDFLRAFTQTLFGIVLLANMVLHLSRASVACDETACVVRYWSSEVYMERGTYPTILESADL